MRKDLIKCVLKVHIRVHDVMYLSADSLYLSTSNIMKRVLAYIIVKHILEYIFVYKASRFKTNL